MAARCEARNVFNRSNSGVLGSNPAQGTDVCVYSVKVAVACVGLNTGPRDSTKCLQDS
jgi:hypothetical protein